MSVQTGDTIAAVSSSIGPAARGIVRLSGPKAVAIADVLFRASDGQKLAARRGYTRWAGSVALRPDGPTLPAEAYLFRAPRSFTRQDLVELHTIGGEAVLALVLEAVLAHGARQAEPGEFTLRAFLSGALDLAQAEGISAVISATTDGQLRAAARLAHGELSTRTNAILDRIADLLALVEADIDFAEEPIDFVSPGQVRATLERIIAAVSAFQQDSAEAELLDALPRIVLTGRPNAGKSTLLNRLTGLDRALCSPLPGTTRDVLSAPLRLDRHEAILLDGAGRTGGGDEISDRADVLLGREIAAADLVCLVIDVAADAPGAPPAITAGTLPPGRTLAIANKTDTLTDDEVERRCDAWRHATGLEVVPISARTGRGCDALRAAMDHRLSAATNVVGAEALALTARHRQALAEATAALRRAAALAQDATETSDCAELIALELREACAALGHIAGEVTTEDLLGRVFSRFCVGK